MSIRFIRYINYISTTTTTTSSSPNLFLYLLYSFCSSSSNNYKKNKKRKTRSSRLSLLSSHTYTSSIITTTTTTMWGKFIQLSTGRENDDDNPNNKDDNDYDDDDDDDDDEQEVLYNDGEVVEEEVEDVDYVDNDVNVDNDMEYYTDDNADEDNDDDNNNNNNDHYNDDQDENVLTPQQHSTAILGNYMGRMATRFMEQVAPTLSIDDDNDDDNYDDKEEQEQEEMMDGEGWGNDDDVIDEIDVSQSERGNHSTTNTNTTTTTNNNDVVTPTTTTTTTIIDNNNIINIPITTDDKEHNLITQSSLNTTTATIELVSAPVPEPEPVPAPLMTNHDEGNDNTDNAWGDDDDVLDLSISEPINNNNKNIEQDTAIDNKIAMTTNSYSPPSIVTDLSMQQQQQQEQPETNTVASIVQSPPIDTIDDTVAAWDEDDYNDLDLSTSEKRLQQVDHPSTIIGDDAAPTTLLDLIPVSSVMNPDGTIAVVDHTPSPQHPKFHQDIDTDTAITDGGVIVDNDDDQNNNYYPTDHITTKSGFIADTTTSVATLAESEDLTRDTGYIGNVVHTKYADKTERENISVYVMNGSGDDNNNVVSNNNNDDDVDDVYDLENEHSYGPVVDHTPSKQIKFVRSTSMLVQIGNKNLNNSNGTNQQEQQQEQQLGDDTVFSVDESVWAEDTLDDSTIAITYTDRSIIHQTPDPTNNVVDLTPATVLNTNNHEAGNPLVDGTTALSVNAIASVGETVDVVQDDEDDKDVNHKFGLVVDITPQAGVTTNMTANAMNNNTITGNSTDIDPSAQHHIHSDTTVDGANTFISMIPNVDGIEHDFEEDEAMEDTYYGDSTIGGAMTDDVNDDEYSENNNENVDEEDGWGLDEEDVTLSNVDDIPIPVPSVPALIGINEARQATFSPTITSFESPLVDHTPSEMPKADGDTEVRTINPSVVALAMSEDDESRDEGIEGDDDHAEVYGDENEEQFGPVVDHTPQQTPRIIRTRSKRPSNVDDLPVDGPVVGKEHDAILDLTSFNGSTVGDVETDAADGGIDDWGDDDDDDDDGEEEERKDDFAKVENVTIPIVHEHTIMSNDQNISLVDHTPSEMDSPIKYPCDGQSVQAHGSIATNTIDNVDEADSIVDTNVVYGPVVDHLPTTAAAALLSISRTDSVLVQGQDDADSVDTTLMGGGSRIDYGEEITYAQMRSNYDASEGKVDDQVVDFIPSRFELGRGDGSTLVAADPSEVLSEVDDLIPEEQNFGPVVDLTPINNAIDMYGPAAGEASVAVFAPPSVAADDLDQEEDGDADTEQAGWHPPAEEEPNPQSGIEEPVVARLVDEQMVDFVPPPANVEAPNIGDTTREALSEMTVGGGQSLLPAGDPIEDDFGPVVDQLPSVAAGSHESTTSQVSASECRAMEKDDQANGYDDSSSLNPKADVVVDHLPSTYGRLLGSTATLGKSLLSEEDEEEEEDASKFGPVVDQLPTSRASLAPSHGGSTVDALANVSEVNSDDEEGDAWDDDDVDFDASYGAVSEGPTRLDTTSTSGLRHPSLSLTPSMDTDRSVRFDSSAYKSNDHAALTTTSKSQYSDSESKGQTVSWNQNNEMTDKSFAEADTPPSTPYRRPDEAVFDTHVENGSNIVLPMLPKSQYSDAASIDELSKLLEDEVSRRQLVEGELESVKKSMEIQVKLAAEFQEELKALRYEKDIATQRYVDLENDTSTLKGVNEKLIGDLNAARDSQSFTQIQKEALDAKSRALEAEVQYFKENVSSSSVESVNDGNLQDSITLLQLMIAEKTEECKEFSMKVEQLQSRLHDADSIIAKKQNESIEVSASLNQTILSLKDQVLGANLLLKNSELSRIELERRIQLLDAEVNKLRSSSVKVSNLQVQHEKDLQQQYTLLDLKSTELRNLENVIEQLRQDKIQMLHDLNKHRDLGEQSELLANELIAVAKERDLLEKALSESRDAILSMQIIIEERGKERQALDMERDRETKEITAALKESQLALSAKEAEVTVLAAELEIVTTTNSELSEKLSMMPDIIQDLEISRDHAVQSAEIDKTKAASLELELTSLRQELSSTIERRDQLEIELSLVNDKMQAIENQLQRVEELESKCISLSSDVEHFRSIANSTNQDYIDELLTEKARLMDENEEMLVQFGLIKQQMDQSEENERMLHNELNAMRLTSVEQNSLAINEMTQLRSQCESLQEQILTIEKERNILQLEQENWKVQATEHTDKLIQLEESRNEMEKQLQDVQEQLAATKRILAEERLASSTSIKESEQQIQILQETVQSRAKYMEELEIRMNELLEQNRQQEEQQAMNASTTNAMIADELLVLQEQIDVLNQLLQSTRDRLAVRENDVDQLCTEIRELKQQNQISLSSSASASVAALSNKTNIDITTTNQQDPNMVLSSSSSSVIERAIQLRRSDSIRQQSMERLELDRQASIDALQQLRDSVTKYYSTTTSSTTTATTM